jgi:hypothetical protein
MIATVSLRLLYLIFSQLLSWLTLLLAHRRRRTSSSSSCATRSPYSAEPTPSPAWTGPTEHCLPHSSDACPRCCAGIAWSPRHGPALAPPPGDQEVDLPEPLRSPTHRPDDCRADRADGPRERDLGLPAHPRGTAQARLPRRRIHRPPDPQAAADTASTAPVHRHVMAPASACANHQHAGRDEYERAA